MAKPLAQAVQYCSLHHCHRGYELHSRPIDYYRSSLAAINDNAKREFFG